MMSEEARLLTLKEAIELPEGTVVWFEETTGGARYIQPMTMGRSGILHGDGIDVNLYEVLMVNRRIWSALPSYEQRRQTPW